MTMHLTDAQPPSGTPPPSGAIDRRTAMGQLAWLVGTAIITPAFGAPSIVAPDRLDAFFRASTILNGFAPPYANPADSYLAALDARFSPGLIDQLVHLALEYPDDSKARHDAISKAGLDQVETTLVSLWYTGMLDDGHGQTRVLHYLGTLAWRAYANACDSEEVTFASTICGGPFGAWQNPVVPEPQQSSPASSER
jgi:hypothetical protein